jgi:phage terminase large subunit-like protein
MTTPDHLPFPNSLCKLRPSAKQRLFLDLRGEREVFFGGAAGGGKSAALLMAALEYITVPGYAALILRKDMARMELAGGVIPRLREWLTEPLAEGKVKWIANRRQWIFPIEDRPPATIMFGYLSRHMDKFRYASSEFQYIAFDELTDFTEEDYLFLFSRLRRNTSIEVPLRMRSASNPGGPGHAWVKERFVMRGPAGAEETGDRKQGTGQSTHEGEPCSLSPVPCSLASTMPPAFYRKHGSIFVPSWAADNPGLDVEEYCRSLMHLPAVERERLMNGDWEVQERGLIQQAWLRYFVEADGQLELIGPDGRSLATIPDGTCRRFVTIDPAGTSEERSREARGAAPSWTVIQVWDQPPRELSRFLLLRHQVRRRVSFDGLCHLIGKVYDEWQPERVWIEGEKLGQAACDVMRYLVPMDCLRTGKDDKVVRAGPLIIKLEKGEIFLPKHDSDWRPTFEAELLAWRGERWQVADQIDAAAYAAHLVKETTPAVIKLRLGLMNAS